MNCVGKVQSEITKLTVKADGWVVDLNNPSPNTDHPRIIDILNCIYSRIYSSFSF